MKAKMKSLVWLIYKNSILVDFKREREFVDSIELFTFLFKILKRDYKVAE